MFNYKKEIESFPTKTGVYIMYDKNENVIYVGKAINLKNRIKQYFNGTDKRSKIERLVSQIENIDFIVTNTETEALILENNLIKENRPKFNTLLKDDKTYPYIEVTLYEEYPRVIVSRGIKNNKSKFFGPFKDATAIEKGINLIQKLYKIRPCDAQIKAGKECLYYQIYKCSAPCTNRISKDDYNESVKDAIKLLSGNNKDILKSLTDKMKNFSKELEFEKAAECRDLIEDLKYLSTKQRINNKKSIDEDIIVIEPNDNEAIIVVFLVRDGKLIDKEHFYMKETVDEETKIILSSFIQQYYSGVSFVPNNIILDTEINEKEIISEWLSEIKQSKVNILIPKKGEKENLIKLAKNNAKILLNENIEKIKRKEKQKLESFEIIRKLIGLKKLERIESYDISNTSGVQNVASMIVFENGLPKKSNYRKFKLKTVGANDYDCIREVIRRRFTDSKLDVFPDLLMIDGGKGQVSSVKEVLDELGINIPICGMVKDDKHNTKGLYYNGKELNIKKDSTEFRLVEKIQNETHRFAINYHRQLRGKKMTESVLDKIPGIGPQKKATLLKEFENVENIKKASKEDLIKIKGISNPLADKIVSFFEGDLF